MKRSTKEDQNAILKPDANTHSSQKRHPLIHPGPSAHWDPMRSHRFRPLPPSASQVNPLKFPNGQNGSTISRPFRFLRRLAIIHSTRYRA